MLDRLLVRMWEVDSIPQQDEWTPDEKMAKDIFVATHKRDGDGRFVVRIPLRKNAMALGNSRAAAKARFHGIEKNFAANKELHTMYKAVFDDYRSKHQMILAPQGIFNDAQGYYLSHHPINTPNGPRNTKKKGKFRVVFDPSVPTSNGVSFNQLQLPGPKLQADLGETLLRFRVDRSALTADIVQMFRQVKVSMLDWNFQRIIWRDSPDEPLSEYVITVVTWGMASAGSNAVRSLRQCAR